MIEQLQFNSYDSDDDCLLVESIQGDLIFRNYSGTYILSAVEEEKLFELLESRRPG